VMRISDLEHETFTDPLTGIYNRRFMEQRLTEELSKARRGIISSSRFCYSISTISSGLTMSMATRPAISY
jgi:GGDEF domain-containing protein